jgi:hypothetical protein
VEDEIVQEVHESRKHIFEECGSDVEQFIEYLRVADANANVRRVTPEEVAERSRSSKSGK